jgi:hypothetical protein
MSMDDIHLKNSQRLLDTKYTFPGAHSPHNQCGEGKVKVMTPGHDGQAGRGLGVKKGKHHREGNVHIVE